MNLRACIAIIIAVSAPACGKKTPPPEPTKAATTEPTKEDVKEPAKEEVAEAPKPDAAEPAPAGDVAAAAGDAAAPAGDAVAAAGDAAAPAGDAAAAADGTALAAMTAADVEKRFRDFLVAGAGDPAALGAWYAEDAMVGIVDSPMQGKGGAGAVEFYKGLKTVYPDFKVEPQLVLIGDHRALGVLLGSGTQTGEMMPGQKPTGKTVSLIGAQYVVFGKDGLIKEDWHFVDQTSLLGQLGLLPPEVPFRGPAEKKAGEATWVLASGSEGEKALVEAHKKAQVALNTKDQAAMAAMGNDVADDVVFHNMTAKADVTGKEAYLKGFADFLKSTPDLTSEGDDIWAAGDYCVHVSKIGGTNSGEMVEEGKTWPATNKPWKVNTVEIQRFEGGKEKEFWMFMNGLAVAQQLGLAPMPGAPPEAPKQP